MENRARKFEEVETQSKFVEDHLSHISVGILLARSDSDTQWICDKVLSIKWSILMKNNVFDNDLLVSLEIKLTIIV